METAQLIYLLERHRQQLLEEPERTMLLAYLAADEHQEQVETIFSELLMLQTPDSTYDAARFEPMLERAVAIDKARATSKVQSIFSWLRYAAILLLIAGVSAYLYTSSFRRNPGVTKTHEALKLQDIRAGSNKAILTLAGGEKIQLDSTANAYLIQKGITNSNSSLSYSQAPALAEMNILTTPRGGQYKLQLSDGTNVWLNAASSISYPTVFTGGKREVTVSGELYFEVMTDAKKPFIVKTHTDEIRVLGTSFNVNAYADEPGVKTSLLQGSVQIGSKILKPGEAYLNGQLLATNVQEDLAWKNGFIRFGGKPLDQAMREIARWYNVEVVYPQGIPRVKVGGELSRNISLQDMITGLGTIDVHVKQEGRRLIVLAK